MGFPLLYWRPAWQVYFPANSLSRQTSSSCCLCSRISYSLVCTCFTTLLDRVELKAFDLINLVLLLIHCNYSNYLLENPLVECLTKQFLFPMKNMMHGILEDFTLELLYKWFPGFSLYSMTRARRLQGPFPSSLLWQCKKLMHVELISLPCFRRKSNSHPKTLLLSLLEIVVRDFTMEL